MHRLHEGARLLAARQRAASLPGGAVQVGSTLRRIWQSRPLAWVFTSATLAVAGDFSHFIERLGLEDRCETLCIDSPFDYARQALLYLPHGPAGSGVTGVCRR